MQSWTRDRLSFCVGGRGHRRRIRHPDRPEFWIGTLNRGMDLICRRLRRPTRRLPHRAPGSDIVLGYVALVIRIDIFEVLGHVWISALGFLQRQMPVMR